MIDYDKKQNAKRLREGLENHVILVAGKGKAKYKDITSLETAEKILLDPDIVRFPATFIFDNEHLKANQFVGVKPVEDNQSEEYSIVIHPLLQNREEDAIKAILYAIVNINYGKIAKEYEAELFASSILGISKEDCHLWAEKLKNELS